MKIKLVNSSTHELSEVCDVFCKIRSLLREYNLLGIGLKNEEIADTEQLTMKKRYNVLDAMINFLYENTKPTPEALIELQKLGLVDDRVNC